MKYLKQYIICAAAALVCLAALAGCSARNSSDSKLILDGKQIPDRAKYDTGDHSRRL